MTNYLLCHPLEKTILSLLSRGSLPGFVFFSPAQREREGGSCQNGFLGELTQKITAFIHGHLRIEELPEAKKQKDLQKTCLIYVVEVSLSFDGKCSRTSFLGM